MKTMFPTFVPSENGPRGIHSFGCKIVFVIVYSID
jgi:hypothetical protein